MKRRPAPLEHVRDTHEAGDELARRPLVDLGRRPDLLDLAVVEHGEAVAHRQRLLLVVRHVDERNAELLLDPLQLDLELLAELEIEGAERLVEQQRLRPVHERTGERDTLSLSARELRRLPVPEPFQPHERQDVLGAASALRSRHLLHAQPVLDVLLHGHVREEGVVLKDRVDVARVRGKSRHVFAAELDRAFVRPLEPGDHAQRRRLARARRAEHREELAATDLEIDPVDGGHVAVALAQAGKADVDLGVTLRRQATPRAGRARARAPHR